MTEKKETSDFTGAVTSPPSCPALGEPACRGGDVFPPPLQSGVIEVDVGDVGCPELERAVLPLVVLCSADWREERRLLLALPSRFEQ